MATSMDFVTFVYEQIQGLGNIRYRKMFGEYMIYVNEKPLLLVCDNTVFIKKRDEIKEDMKDCEVGIPYQGAKEHYILDVENRDFAWQVLEKLEKITPLPKPKKKKQT